MILKEYIDPVFKMDLEEIKDMSLEEVILHFHAKNINRLYIIKENRAIFVITPQEIVDFFVNHNIKQNAYEFFKDKEPINCYESSKHIIDTYYEMRRENLEFIPVCEDGKLVGEVDFNVLSLKISYIVIKDELTGVYNKKYFDVIIEEYADFDKPLGIIFIELEDLSIYEGLYGVNFYNEVIKEFANTISRSIRKIDFVFRWDNQFRIIIFNTLEVTAKVFERIQGRLKNLNIEDIHLPFKMCFSHIPEMEDDILLALESCEERLVKGN